MQMYAGGYARLAYDGSEELIPFDRTVPYNDLPLLPPAVDLETAPVLKQAIASARALEKLRGVAARIPNQRVVINGLVLQEARLSSEIENIVTTNDQLYRAAAGGDLFDDASTKEVFRYREALWYGFDRMKTRPFSTNLYVEIVGIIRQLDHGIRPTQGTDLKSHQGEVIYTPPQGEQVIREKLSNLDEFLHAPSELDPLVKLAVLHYQFEAIHPFSDGNGRTGRILNVLYLVQEGLLDLPVLYLSQFILKHKAKYYAGLRGVTEEQRWEEWILFILKAVEETAKTTCTLVIRILGLMAEVSDVVRARDRAIYSKELIEVIFSNPYCRIRFIEDSLSVQSQTASKYLRRLAELGILEPAKVGREIYYFNSPLMEALTGVTSAKPKPFTQ